MLIFTGFPTGLYRMSTSCGNITALALIQSHRLFLHDPVTVQRRAMKNALRIGKNTLYKKCIFYFVRKLRRRQWRQAQANLAQRRHIIFHNQWQIIPQINFQIRAQWRAFDEMPQTFQ